jgi:hypothetical protein
LAGAVAVRMLADRSGLTEALSGVLARRGFTPVYDRGRVLTDVATAIACGARDIVDVEALRAQAEVFGPVASDTTVLRALGEIGCGKRARIARVRAAARAHVWSQLAARLPESTFAGGVCQPGMVVLRTHASLVVSHSGRNAPPPRSRRPSAITRWAAGSTTPASWPACGCGPVTPDRTPQPTSSTSSPMRSPRSPNGGGAGCWSPATGPAPATTSSTG